MMVILTILALFAGLLYGIFEINFPVISILSEHSDFILYLLMFSVGISVGMYQGIVRKIKAYHLRIFIIPLGTILGSVTGGLLCSVFLHMPLEQGTAVASGMGWYSLAGVTIGNLGGAELGSIAFLSNLMREIFSFLLIPLLAVKLNFYTCIAPAGATSEDTTLPVILKYTNEEIVVLSVLNGMICSFFVPLLISFCFYFF